MSLSSLNPNMIMLTTQQKAAQLTDAFHLFNQLSEDLIESYQSLQTQVAQLNAELAAARHERVKTLMEKEKLAQRLQIILAALPAAVLVLGDKDIIIDCNQMAMTYLGCDILGKTWSSVFSAAVKPLVDSPQEWSLANGTRISMTHTHLGAAGGQLVVLTDVTDMRQLQETLNQQKHLAAMGEMVASLAHQVRTPLATAILYASQLEKNVLDNGKRQQFSAKILKRLHYLDRQVNDMLLFAKDGKSMVGSFALSEVINGLAEQVADYRPNSHIAFVLTDFSQHVQLRGNSDALRGALLNLLINALEAFDNRGVVSLTLWQDNHSLHCLIKDNGKGIAHHDLIQIFEPFYTTKMQGSGLGLAVVINVIHAFGGQMRCYSEPGRGSAFSFTLPCERGCQTAILASDFAKLT